jgi:hypothetical protein
MNAVATSGGGISYLSQLEREERERQQKLEQARIDRLLDESAALRRATDIRLRRCRERGRSS